LVLARIGVGAVLLHRVGEHPLLAPLLVVALDPLHLGQDALRLGGAVGVAVERGVHHHLAARPRHDLEAAGEIGQPQLRRPGRKGLVESAGLLGGMDGGRPGAQQENQCRGQLGHSGIGFQNEFHNGPPSSRYGHTTGDGGRRLQFPRPALDSCRFSPILFANAFRHNEEDACADRSSPGLSPRPSRLSGFNPPSPRPLRSSRRPGRPWAISSPRTPAGAGRRRCPGRRTAGSWPTSGPRKGKRRGRDRRSSCGPSTSRPASARCCFARPTWVTRRRTTRTRRTKRPKSRNTPGPPRAMLFWWWPAATSISNPWQATPRGG